MVKNVIKGCFSISKVLVCGFNSYLRGKKMKILDYFMIAHLKNVIKGSFPISKVLVFEGNSYECGINEDIRLFYDCTW